MLQAYSHKDVWVFIHKAVVSGIFNKGGAKEHDIVKASPEVPRSWFSRYCVLPELVGPTVRALKGRFFGSIYIYIYVFDVLKTEQLAAACS